MIPENQVTLTPEKVLILVEGLIDIGSFVEGPFVNSSFDEPVSLQGMKQSDRIECPWCKRELTWYIPRGGDGSALEAIESSHLNLHEN